MAREYAKVSPRFWTGDTGKKLRSNRGAQVLATYLISAPGSSMTGIYYLPLPIVSHETGMTMAEVIEALTFLAGIDFAHYDGVAELVWVPAMAAWQIDDELKPDDNRVKGIKRELASLRGHSFVAQFWERYGRVFSLGTSPCEAPAKPLRSQEHDQDQDQKQEEEKKNAAVPASTLFPLPDPEPPAAPAELTFPDKFLEVWAYTGKHGSKQKAFKAWKKRRPGLSEIKTAWDAYMRTGEAKSGCIYHLSTWLNDNGWLQEWNPSNGRSDARGSPAPTPFLEVMPPLLPLGLRK